MNKLLLIYNPSSGTRKSARFLSDVSEVFTRHGYLVTALPTLKRGDATGYVKDFGPDHDLVVVMGGDGTYNEVVSGYVASGLKMPIGYIPAGSTNDFAQGLKLSKDMLTAAEDIATGKPSGIDVGLFNGRVFTYVASFGAFTKASYETPQSIKNTLGHLAYILSGASTLADIRPIHARIRTEDAEYEGDYLFGAISNSTSMGGILKLKPEDVDFSDGLFELLLLRTSDDILEISDLVRAVAEQEYDTTPMLTFVESRRFEIEIPEAVDWSLDGEYQKGVQNITIENLREAVNLIIK
ncbi:MAG: diacylglycerol kinase family lipid kinase [Firmicutes bacterium]|nr:diacylglycerol kinase family lipid kinase [Bacillota bacterium]